MLFQVVLTILTILPGFILAAKTTKAISASEDRIVGGQISEKHIPYQIALYNDGSFSCGGTVLTKKCILTAGHCVKGVSPKSFKVRAGILKLSSTGGQSSAVSKSFVPNTFNLSMMYYDVAILKLTTPLNITSNVKPVTLATTQMHDDETFRVSGWGLTKESGTSVSDHLRYVFVPTISRKKCESQYPGQIKSTMFCAQVQGGGKDSCSGDSGGPVVKNNVQYGIVSWGYGCARPNYAGVYTSVRQVLPWIKKIKAANCM